MSVSKYDIELDLANPETSHAKMVDLVGANKRVLDVGCSTGYLARALSAFGNTVSGIEYDKAAAEQARPYLDKLVVGDLETLDLVAEFGEGQYEVIVFGDVLEHLRDPLPVLRQARPMLAPGGSVVISIPNIAHGDVRLALLHGRFRYGRLGLLDETHTRFFTRESLQEFLHDAGFAPVDVRRTTAALFSTEIGVREQDYDPAVVEAVRRDPEATTYQFVLRAVRDDALHVDAQLTERAERQELRIGELQDEVAGLRGQVDRDRAEIGRLHGDVDQAGERVAQAHAERGAATERVTALERELGEVRRRLDEQVAELERLQHTRLMRSTRLPRAVYGALRRR